MITKCGVCGSSLRTIYKLRYEDIMGMNNGFYTQFIGICESCGLIITQNPFSAEQLASRYSKMSKFEYENDDYFLNANDEYLQRSQHQKHFIYEHIANGDIKTVMEVGAASGYNLSLYREQGCHCLGIEPSAANCNSARKRYGIEMFNGTFDQYINMSNIEKYDLIILSMTLEHIVNPYQFILACKKLNSKYIFIEVPTLDVKWLSEPMGMFCEEHVNYFTFHGLYSLMRAAGYGIINAEIPFGIDERLPAGWPALDTLWELGKQDGYNLKTIISSENILGAYIKENQMLLNEVQKKIENIPNGIRLAVWGTGHHVSMLLGNTSLGSKNIICFYDSDKRRFSWKMMNREIKEFSASSLRKDKIDAILIGSYIYQEEIYSQLLSYSKQYKIYRLY